jgi:hypothetical protein
VSSGRGRHIARKDGLERARDGQPVLDGSILAIFVAGVFDGISVPRRVPRRVRSRNEVDPRDRHIDGSLTSLASEMRAVVQKFEPEWVDRNGADPGITLLEVAAWLSQAVLHRSTTDPQAARRAAIRVVGALSALTGRINPPRTSVPLSDPGWAWLLSP